MCPMRIKNYLLPVIILLFSYSINAQVVKAFTPRLPGGNIKIKGDIVFVGNNIVNRTGTIDYTGIENSFPQAASGVLPTYDGAGVVTNQAALTAAANIPYNGPYANNPFNFDYIDIDGDSSTFSSSTADLNITSSCKKIVYAGLYWTATYPFERIRHESPGDILIPRQTDFNQIKFKLPGGVYLPIVADDIIVNGITETVPPVGTQVGPQPVYGKPYVCYKNVTALVQGLTNANGIYAVANQRAQLGTYTGTGSSAGWSMVIIYEDPALPSKYISTFDGYANVDGDNRRSNNGEIDFNINGFVTLPAPFPVRAKIGVAALEGDLQYTGDNLRFKANTFAGGFTDITNTTNPLNNFFNASITNNNIPVTTRNINSTNTLGFDLDIVGVPPGIVPNNETGATIKLTTGGDAYGPYLTTFDVEIIEPKIVLTKTAQANIPLGGPLVDIAGQDVTLCQELQYTIGFQNLGNDDAISYTIKDVLPPNTSLSDPLLVPSNFILPTPPTGISPITFTYNAATREVIFTIPNGFVIKNGPRYVIKIKARVLCNCNDLDDACSNQITNQAFSTYQGSLNTQVITNDPSLSSFSACNINPPSPTNTLVGLDSCNFTTTVTLCGTSVRLDAAPGYQIYTWSGPLGATITPVTGTNNASVIVNQLGTYTVNNLIAVTPCKSITQTIIVKDISAGVNPLTNPVLALVPSPDIIVKICPGNNIPLPEINLCGNGATKLITSSATGYLTISWEKLNGVCLPLPNPNCANENSSCTWTVVDGDNDPYYTANTAGQYRVVYNFPGNCPRTFYFNVYKNTLSATIIPRDFVCNTPGNITINGVPAGYEYSLNCTGTYLPMTTANSFTFNVPIPGNYTVCIRQTGVPGGCVFTYTNINIGQRTFTSGEFITQPICADGKGCIRIDAIGVYPQYTYTVNRISAPAGPIGTYGPTNSSSTPSGPVPANPFCNLSPGSYTYTITTQDGCTITKPFTINQPAPITITAAITKPLSCAPGGEITVYPVGGTPPYNFSVSGAQTVVTQSSPIIAAPVAGNYCITVTDANLCKAAVCQTIALTPTPVFTVAATNVLCYGSNTGAINFNVTNSNGFTIGYSITGGAPFLPGASFTNLVAGTYPTMIQYTLGTSVCTSTPVNVTITQPFALLTASAGVSELAGCGPAGEGKVRITNPQGGVGPYTYSFNNQVTYTAINEAYLPCGTYTVYIKDANGCIFAMPVILDCAPTPPTIVVSPPVFACNGNATSTVTVTNPNPLNNFAYTYQLDTVFNTPPTNPIFTNVPCGPHNVIVNYKILSVPTFSNLLFEDFGIGANTTTPGINTAYCFENQSGIHPVGYTCNLDNFINDGEYGVTSRINPRFGVWNDPKDHTSNGTVTLGRFLCVNIGGTAGIGGILYSKPISNIIPNQDINVSLWAMNLIKNTAPGLGDPNLTIQLIANLGLPTQVIVATTPVATPIVVPKSNIWEFYSLALNPGAYTSLSFVIRSYSNVINGNDVVIDDINVFQLPKACITTRNFPIDIACNQAFTAQVTGTNNVTCNGLTNGSITIAAQNYAPSGYFYSTNGGSTWSAPITTPTFTISSLAPVTYNIQVSYSNPPTGAVCNFPFTTTITQPTAITGTVAVTQPTCLTGGVIVVTASGGTGALQYQILTSLGAPVPGFVGYQNSNTFSNVPYLPTGSYVVTVRDASLCVIPTSIPVNLVPPATINASIAATSNYCYSSPAGASLVVTTSGGVLPYEYILNTNAPQSGNIFNNLTPGTYTITVRDAAGCTKILLPQTIEPQLTLNSILVKDLDCSALPNASFSGTIANGYPIYTVAVSINAGAFTSIPLATATTYTYATPSAGTYQFEVTDSRGCKARSIVYTIAPLSLPQVTVTQIAPIKCNGDSTGAISVVINTAVGTAAYTYVVNRTLPTPFNYGTQTTGLPAGTYCVTLTDGKFCTDTKCVTITEPAVITYTTTINPLVCSGAGITLGSICVNAPTGGTAPYVYTLIDQNTGTPTTFPLVGTTPSITHCFTALNFGLYTIEVTDANGCTVVKPNLIMSSPPTDLAFGITSLGATCAAGACIQIDVNPTLAAFGGGPYVFGLVNLPPPLYSSSFQPIIAGPPYGPGPFPLTYNLCGLPTGSVVTIVVKDLTSGCLYFETFTTALPTNSNLTSVINTVNNVTCNGSANGNVSVTVNNYSLTTTSINYVVNNNLGQPVLGTAGSISFPAGPSIPRPIPNIGPLAPGTYTIYFTEQGGLDPGCGATSASFTITEAPTVLTITASSTKNDNCNVNAGQIVAVGAGGAGGYTYQILPAPSGVPLASSPLWLASGNVLNAESGTYDVYVKDANGCIKQTLGIIIPLDPIPVVAAVLANQCVAQGAYVINVTLPTTGVPPYTFSLDNGAYVTNIAPFSYTGLSSGTHSVGVKDFNGCGNIVSVTILNPLIVSATFTTQPTCFNNNGTITAVAFGGSGNYNYTLLTVLAVVITGPQPGAVFLNQPAGSYIIRVTDTTTLCTQDFPFSISLPTPVAFIATPVAVTCSGGSDGTITVTLPASNNNPVYTYAITAGPLTFPAQVGNTFIGLPAGTYTVQVTSGRGCTLTDNNVIIGTPNPIVVPLPIVTQFGCTSGPNVVNNATIVVNGVNGGSSTYTYEFVLAGVVVQALSNSNTYTTANLVGGTYTINVVDSKGCKGTATAIINPFISISNPTVVVNKLIDCNTGENITVSVTTTGGVAPLYIYNATKVPVAVLPVYNVTNNSGVFTGLPIGDYQITVTNSITGCSVKTFHYVNTPNTFNLLINNLTTVTCFGDSNGSADITVVDTNLVPTNDAGPFNWTILNSLGVTVQSGGPTPSAGPFTVIGLPSGIYTANIVLANSPFCPVTQNFTIVQPDAPLAVTAVKSQIKCVPGNDGIIVASTTGGWGTNYTFQLQNGVAVVTNTVGTTYSYALNGTNTTFTNLAPGIYTVFVKDEKNCERSFPITLTSPLPIAANFTPGAPILCFGVCNGSITVSYPSGGQGSNYSYVLHSATPSDSGPIAIPLGGITISNLCAGVYDVDIIDGFGCTLNSGSITISQPTKVVAALSTNTTQTCFTQATLLLTGSGGTPPYRWQLNGVGGFSLPFVSTTTVSVPVGTYNYVITDANGCRSDVSGDVTISPLDPFVIASLTHQDILCGGLPDGTITAVANGGLLNYTYTLLNSSLVLIPGAVQSPPNSGNFINLLAGTYFVEVKGGIDCAVISIPVIIKEPPVFKYTLTPNLVKCNGDPTGSITISYSGGTGPYVYAISSASPPVLFQPINITSNPFVINGLVANTYSIIVRDSNGCFQLPPGNIVDTIIVSEPTALTSTITGFVNEKCAEQDLGQITLGGISGGTGPYTVSYTVVYPDNTVFTLPPVAIATAAGYVFNNLNGGNYITIVKDANGCLSEQSQKIGSGVSYDAKAIVTFPCVANNPAVRVEVVNILNIPNLTFDPAADYSFNLDVNSFATAQASPIFTSAAYPSLLVPGSHTIYVFNANGCNKATQVFTITAADVDALTLTLAQGGLNEIVATSTGGSGGNNYTFNGNNNGSDNTYVYDATGDYTVTVTDNSGCSKTVTKPFVFIPIKIINVFTPDGNGINDGWGPTNTANYPNLVTIVYDRYGRKIAELPEGKFWNGKYNGQELPSGDYWYVIRVDARNDSEYVGHFTLYR